MKNRIRPTLIGTTLFLILSNSSCASLLLDLPPTLAQRTLRLSRDAPVLEYQYQACVQKFLGLCTKSEMHKDVYDLRDDATRRQLVDMNFVLKVREKQ